MNNDELKKKIGDEAFHITQEKGTEAPFSGKYVHTKDAGKYACVVCGTQLFVSDTKFDSGTGWPSFDSAIPGKVRRLIDTSHGMTREEVTCATCGAHLGHVFSDGPKDTTGERFCINSACLAFDPEKDSKA